MRLHVTSSLLAVTLLGACHRDPQKDTGETPVESGCADPVTWYADHDADGFGDAATSTSACEPPDGYVADATDCDDAAGSVNPGAPEVWYDGADEDCSGGSDFDQDGDGYDRDTECDDLDPARYPDPEIVEVWYNGVDENCDGNDGDQDGDGWYEAGYPFEVPDGYAGFVNDCWDDPAHDDGWRPVNGFPAPAARDVHPTAAEVWYDGIDQDCAADDDFDADHDAARTDVWPDREGVRGDDCLDTDPAVHPGAPETWYDGIDQDCAGDDDFDADTDGWDAPGGTGPVDCADADPARNPGAVETCASPDDDDCDGATNEADAVGCVIYYVDLDGDGYGTTESACLCAPDGGYSVLVGGDCDDAAADVHPGHPEACDGRDEDCDGAVDDGLTVHYPDLDGDGYGSGAGSCSGDGSTRADDCDDGDRYVFPGAAELCDGQQNDCAAPWTTVDEEGTASVASAGGVWTDVTSVLAAGSTASAAAWTLQDNAQLVVCPGTWYVHLGADAATSTTEILGLYGPEVTVLDGADSDAVISTVGGSAVDLAVSGVTVERGLGLNGAGVYVNGGTLSMTDSIVTKNEATSFGGGIYAVNAIVSLVSSLIDSNTAAAGGGLYTDATDLFLEDVAVVANIAQSAPSNGGGGVSFSSSGGNTLSIVDSSFTQNQSNVSTGTAYAGALDIYQAGSGITQISTTQFTSNAATATGGSYPLAVGGAIYAYLSSSGATTLTDVTMTSNNAFASYEAEGGALYLWNQGIAPVTLSGVSATYNYVLGSTTYGGGLLLSGTGSGPITVESSTIVSNMDYTPSYAVGGSGGGMYTNLSATTMTIDGTTFETNSATYGAGIYASVAVASTVTLQNGTAIQGNVGHGVELQALDSASHFLLDDSRITDNTSIGLYLQASGASAGINAACHGTAAEAAGIYENGGVGVYGGCTSFAVCTFQANACDFDNPATGASNTGYDVYMYGLSANYLANASFNCNGILCL